MNGKNITLSLIALLAMATAFIISDRAKFDQSDLHGSAADNKSASHSFESATPVAIRQFEKELANSNELVEEAAPPDFTQTDFNVVRNWMSDRGYIDSNLREIYKSYPFEALVKLASEGDLTAIDLMANMALGKGNIKIGISYLNLAAIYGSTSALDRLTAFSAPHYPNDKTEAQRRPSVLETLAIAKSIEYRGDLNLATTSASSFAQSYKRLYQTELNLTSKEATYIERRARNIYDKLQKERIERGLGDFDNSILQSVNNFHKLGEN